MISSKNIGAAMRTEIFESHKSLKGITNSMPQTVIRNCKFNKFSSDMEKERIFLQLFEVK